MHPTTSPRSTPVLFPLNPAPVFSSPNPSLREGLDEFAALVPVDRSAAGAKLAPAGGIASPCAVFRGVAHELARQPRQPRTPRNFVRALFERGPPGGGFSWSASSPAAAGGTRGPMPLVAASSMPEVGTHPPSAAVVGRLHPPTQPQLRLPTRIPPVRWWLAGEPSEGRVLDVTELAGPPTAALWLWNPPV
jgi:hypothetical protein